MSRLRDKIVLITGASSGIGRATALEYAKHGSKLILCARRTGRLEELRSQLKTPVHTITMDVRDRSQVFQAIAELPTEFKNVDILINNAGLVMGVDPVETVPSESVNTMFDTNVKGLLNVTQALLPGMKQRNQGWIVNVSSIAGTEAYANGSIYCATKHAVTAITKSLRHELNATGINVISIEPGMVETEFSVVRFGGDKEKAKKVYEGLEPLTGEDIAETIVFTTSRPPHVQIASVVIFPTNQSAATTAFRKTQ
jgi:3-hydroxy acid dehydrogenase / malonic semialdehyde reductase